MKNNYKVFDTACEEYLRLDNLIKALTEERDSYKEDIKTYMKERNLEQFYSPNHHVNITQVTQNRIDSKLLKALFPDAHTACTKQSTYERVTIR